MTVWISQTSPQNGLQESWIKTIGVSRLVNDAANSTSLCFFCSLHSDHRTVRSGYVFRLLTLGLNAVLAKKSLVRWYYDSITRVCCAAVNLRLTVCDSNASAFLSLLINGPLADCRPGKVYNPELDWSTLWTPRGALHTSILPLCAHNKKAPLISFGFFLIHQTVIGGLGQEDQGGKVVTFFISCGWAVSTHWVLTEYKRSKPKNRNSIKSASSLGIDVLAYVSKTLLLSNCRSSDD